MTGHARTLQADEARALLVHLRERTSAMADLVLELVRAESPSDDPEAQGEPMRILSEALAPLGFRMRRLRGRATGGHLLAVPRGRDRGTPLQLLLGHCDTVWPVGTLRSMPAETRDGRLRGPGSYDMKGGLVQAIFALRALHEHDLSTPVLPIVFVNSDEEIGSPESMVHIERLARVCDRAFVLEPSLGPSGLLKTARKGVGRYTVHVTGRAAHAGLDPEAGASAILELSHVVQELFKLNDIERGVTVNVGTIEGGIRPNVIAPESNAHVDVRVLHRHDAARIEEAIFDLRPRTPGTSLRVEGGFNRPPMDRTPANGRLWSRAVSLAAELGIEIDEGTAGGGSDGNTTSLFTPTLDGLGAVGNGAHAAHEHVIVERMPERAALLAGLLMEGPLEGSHH